MSGSHKNILVTGGARGVGKAITHCLLGEGYNVCVLSSNDQNLKALGEDATKYPGSYTYFCVNLASRAEVITFCNNWQKPIYAIVNNAATNSPERLAENINDINYSLSVWDEILQVNTVTPFMLCKALLPQITRPGRIINIASQLGHEGRVAYGAYCASKWALIGLTKTWAKELGPEGITVNAVSPGWVKTELHEEKLKYYARRLGDVSLLEAEDYIENNLELRRFNTSEEVAEIVKFLISSAARGVSGRSWLMSSIYSFE